MARPRRKPKADPWREELAKGWHTTTRHPLFRSFHPTLRPDDDGVLPGGVQARITAHGVVLYDPARRAEAPEWAWIFAHLLLHLGLGHTDPATAGPRDIGAPVGEPGWTQRLPDPAYHAACCLAADRFLASLKLGRCPYPPPEAAPASDERTLARLWRDGGVPAECRPAGPADFLIANAEPHPCDDYRRLFAIGLAEAATTALDEAGGRRDAAAEKPKGPWDAALGWFVSSYPLLGALAAGMTVVADAELARAWRISLAAVNAQAAEIYVNPLAGLSADEWRFVLAHEMLHAALRHGERAGGRDPYLWNVAADFVINGWLAEMDVGTMPEGVLHDPALAGLSAEDVYDRIAGDLRRLRKLATLRGRGLGDVLDHPLPHGDAPGRYVDLDDYYRSALSTGLAYHQSRGRGLIPYGLEEEIRALDHPPLPWDARLAAWFDEHVPAAERRRSYARASRRQSATPDIPRPGWVRPEEQVRRATFGVVLDTSGSMDGGLLGKALGAIASYATARDVPHARVVFCDAAPYDAGYLAVEDIAGRVRVRGRGGTALQPAVELLERAQDFPPEGPILIITDGWCDTLRVRREHAYLIPAGASLPFRPKGPVFHVS